MRVAGSGAERAAATKVARQASRPRERRKLRDRA